MEEEARRRGGGERRVEDKRKRSPSREDLVSSTSRNDILELDTGYQKVYISWDRFVPEFHSSAFQSLWGGGVYLDGRQRCLLWFCQLRQRGGG